MAAIDQKILLTVDVLIFRALKSGVEVLLVKRGIPPFQGAWAIPGGFVREDESLDAAALRELREETGFEPSYLEQLYSFGEVKRDPRGRVVSVAYFAFVNTEGVLRAGSDASAAQWYRLGEIPKLAFDHEKIFQYALERLKNKLEYTTVGFELVGKKFTLTEVQRIYEDVLRKKLDKRNFRKKVLQLKILKPLKEHRKEGLTRPARLYQLNLGQFEKLKDRGILFPW